MPTFELAILMKALPRSELVAALKRTATTIFDEGGVIRKIDNLGFKPTPFKISSHGAPHRQAHYFVFQFDIGKPSRKTLMENFALDVDVVRCRIIYRNALKFKEEEEQKCTLHLDLLPPPYRPHVQEMIAQGEKRLKPKFQYNSGMNYYPFQR